jgi:plastocyanin
MRTNLALVAFLALTTVACGDSTSPTDLCANSGAAVTVTAADDYTFTPSSITVSSGQAVCWQNTGNLNHTVIDAGGRFGFSLPAGQTFVYTFLGTQQPYAYRCGIHSTMTGTTTVN